MNGLVTDLQMFALKTLKIPLPGRHPPSPCLCNGSDSARLNRSKQNPPRPVKTGIFDSFKTLKPNSSERKVSAAMSSLQGYYGLKPKYEKSKQEGFEMAIYSKRSSNFLEDDQCLKPSSSSNPPLSLNRKSKSLADGLSDDNNRVQVGETNCEEKNEKFTSRRLKSEADSPELLIRDDNNSGGAFSAITGKCLALRSKGACRSSSSAEPEAGGVTPIPINLMDSPIDDGVSVIKKSYSASSFQEQDGSNSSIWQASKWSMKPDLQALTASAITKQIFDGLSNPITGRRNKAALD
ncbi:hypothetical protein K2173_006876 [Erythroxylum novogranatense]|uniref:Uncharacterized protein n=1 Tax=Erythroxylum novogranatense TaxID=1862640 RepID=A0AAV8SY05_9ROSI|nr:hypothetical protein K2173_006876 [Erythroxylum novogranatense]